MRLISWNVNKPAAARVRVQAAALGARRPDVVALQEVRASTLGVWREELARIGLGYVACSLEGVAEALADRRRATGGVVVASRWPLAAAEPALVPWPERVLSVMVVGAPRVVVGAPRGAVEVHAAYVPNSVTGGEVGHPWLKVEVFEGIIRRLARAAERPRLLCGDFNVPLREEADGTIVPFGRRGRAAAAELGVLGGLAAHGLPDVFRSLHGYGVQEFSWYSHRANGFRLDHLFASPELGAVACRYLQELRVRGVSDHAAIEGEFGWGAG